MADREPTPEEIEASVAKAKAETHLMVIGQTVENVLFQTNETMICDVTTTSIQNNMKRCMLLNVGYVPFAKNQRLRFMASMRL